MVWVYSLESSYAIGLMLLFSPTWRSPRRSTSRSRWPVSPGVTSGPCRPSLGRGREYAAVVLAGGRAADGRADQAAVRRRRGVDAGPGARRRLHAAPRVVAGPEPLATVLPAGVALTREQPHGSGPVAAASAGLALVAPGTPYVALLAADLPFLTTAAVTALRRVLADNSTVDGALFVDAHGQAQLLCGLWRVDALRANLTALGDPAGQSVRRLLAGLRTAELSWTDPGPRRGTTATPNRICEPHGSGRHERVGRVDGGGLPGTRTGPHGRGPDHGCSISPGTWPITCSGPARRSPRTCSVWPWGAARTRGTRRSGSRTSRAPGRRRVAPRVGPNRRPVERAGAGRSAVT